MSKQSNHTPGPWHWETARTLQHLHCATHGLAFSTHTDGGDTHAANARLIASAPDLLDALSLMVQLASAEVHIGNAALDNARAAIAKARGE